LLTGQDGFSWYEAASAVAASLGIKIVAYRIGSDGGLFDRGNEVLARLGVGTDGAIVIRLDGFVAWRTHTLTTAPQSRLEQVLKRVLC
jgi:putative polyketide hydroxylase